MQDILDFNQDESKHENVVYADFWSRVWATLIDGVLVLVASLVLSAINLFSSGLDLLVMILPLAYKIIMEFTYGQTLGKIAIGIEVRSQSLDRPTLSQILLRNILGIINDGWEFVQTVMWRLSMPISNISYFGLESITPFAGLLFVAWIVDILFVFNDPYGRTLHDRLGGTVVVLKDTLR